VKKLKKRLTGLMSLLLAAVALLPGLFLCAVLCAMPGSQVKAYGLMPDYRATCTSSTGDECAVREINITTRWCNVRFVLPRIGFSLWNGSGHQIARHNYPATG
jgi:hypothetical protein